MSIEMDTHTDKLPQMEATPKLLRIQQGKSLRDVARPVGISPTSLQLYELYARVPTTLVAERWADELGIPHESLNEMIKKGIAEREARGVAR